MRLAETMLCFLRPFNISHSLQTAAAVFSLGAELSLIHLSSFLGPPHSKSQVVSSATVCFNGDCEENARGVLYSGDGFELVMLMNDSWGIPLRLGDGFLVREIEIQVAKQ